jgi:hypothetical protein
MAILSRSVPLEVRFWSRVNKTATCWLWTGSIRNQFGYGRIRANNVTWPTHRLSWVLANGPIPDGLWVLHRCDNPRCVRPDHLFLGTPKDNSQDRDAKGRHRVVRGERQGSSKLTVNQVREIRTLYATGSVSYRSLAQQFDVSVTTIGFIITRKRWNWC